MKILILLPYFDRPNFVINALFNIPWNDSWNEVDWELAFIDDGSSTPGEPIVRHLLADHLDKVRFYNTNSTREDKIKCGSTLGKYLNQAIKDSDAELCIVLNDDDMLYECYLFNVIQFMSKRPNHISCFSKIKLYFNINHDEKNRLTPLIDLLTEYCPYNQWTGFINPYLTVEWCQVAWRTTVNKVHDIWFDEVCDANHDVFFFKRMGEKLGNCCGNTTFYSQYKMYHSAQASRKAFASGGRWGVDPNVLYSETEYPYDDKELIFDEAMAQAKFWINHQQPEKSKNILENAMQFSEREDIKELYNNLNNHFPEVEQYYKNLDTIL